MNTKASCIVLPVITLLALVALLRSLPQPVSQSSPPVMSTAEQTQDGRAVAWTPEQTDSALTDKDLLEMPLNSLQSEVQWLSAQHGWRATWFSLLLPQVVKLNCGVDMASLSLPRQIEQANLLSLVLEANLSPDVRAALGAEDKMLVMHQHLKGQMQGVSAEVQADFAHAAANRLTAIVPNASSLETAPHDSRVMATLHLAILYDVWRQTEPLEPTAVGEVGASCTVPADDQEHYNPVRLALR